MDRAASPQTGGSGEDIDGIASTRIGHNQQKNRQIHHRYTGGNAEPDWKTGKAGGRLKSNLLLSNIFNHLITLADQNQE